MKESTPTLKYLSIKPVKIENTPGIVKSIEDAFEWSGNKSFTDKLVGSSVNGASVNLGKHKGVDKLVQESHLAANDPLFQPSSWTCFEGCI